jgi:hypothetical protein
VANSRSSHRMSGSWAEHQPPAMATMGAERTLAGQASDFRFWRENCRKVQLNARWTIDRNSPLRSSRRGCGNRLLSVTCLLCVPIRRALSELRSPCPIIRPASPARRSAERVHPIGATTMRQTCAGRRLDVASCAVQRPMLRSHETSRSLGFFEICIFKHIRRGLQTPVNGHRRCSR